jgi:hypothetical protein
MSEEIVDYKKIRFADQLLKKWEDEAFDYPLVIMIEIICKKRTRASTRVINLVKSIINDLIVIYMFWKEFFEEIYELEFVMDSEKRISWENKVLNLHLCYFIQAKYAQRVICETFDAISRNYCWANPVYYINKLTKTLNWLIKNTSKKNEKEKNWATSAESLLKELNKFESNEINEKLMLMRNLSNGYNLPKRKNTTNFFEKTE